MKFNSFKELNDYAKNQMRIIAKTKLNYIVMEVLREFVMKKVYQDHIPLE